jgi:serine/threonine protein kinase
MHEAGYAHRDLKPANVMWLPRENQWRLIDFGSATPLGQEVPLSFTLAYAAPEVIAVWKSGAKKCMSTAAVDAWALGVMVYELLMGKPAFDVFLQGRDVVRPFCFCLPKNCLRLSVLQSACFRYQYCCQSL